MNDKPVILYVDDEEANLLIFRISFEEKREVLLARSPEEGLEKLAENKNRIKAVISDMHMPKMNGVEFIRQAQQTLDDIPYFILSGYAFNEDIDEALKQNTIKRFFTKPFNKDEIEKHLKETGS